jgi:cytochrome c peroxidase
VALIAYCSLRILGLVGLLFGPTIILAAQPTWRPAWPAGFAEPVVPADNLPTVERVRLGEWLFADRRLSETGEHSCVSCHDPLRAFTEAQPVSRGARGDRLPRNAPSILYSAWNPSLGWDRPGNVTLESQLQVPLFSRHPIELGLSGNEARALAQLSADSAMQAQFRLAFPDESKPVTLQNVIRAIASFERSLGEASSAFDRYLYRGEVTALDDRARRGLDLFFSERLGCTRCHQGPAFSGPARSMAEPEVSALFASNGYLDGATLRVPSLRNVAVTAPYMRDGSLASLDEVIDHYDRGSAVAKPPLAPLNLTAGEKADLLSFLVSLTDRPYERWLNRP